MVEAEFERELAAYRLADEYAAAVNDRDEARWAACWSEDEAEWAFRGRLIVGKQAIVETWRDAMAGFDEIWFRNFVDRVEIDGVTARTHIRTFEYLRPTGGDGRLQRGFYTDLLVRQGDGWAFRRRSFQIVENHQ